MIAFVIAKDIGMMQSNRRSFLISLEEQLCDKERLRRLVSTKCMQFAPEATSSRVEVTLPHRKRTTCKLQYARKIKPGSSAATAENMSVVSVQN